MDEVFRVLPYWAWAPFCLGLAVIVVAVALAIMVVAAFTVDYALKKSGELKLAYEFVMWRREKKRRDGGWVIAADSFSARFRDCLVTLQRGRIVVMFGANAKEHEVSVPDAVVKKLVDLAHAPPRMREMVTKYEVKQHD